jgi:hypothetical protein
LNSNIENQEMKDYLLGTLEAERRMALEERILCDPEVYEELLVVEEELIDQYVAGALPQFEQRLFETHFLITAERQKNLRFGRLLKRYVNSHPVLIPHENLSGAVRQAEKAAPAKKSSLFLPSLFSRGPALAFSAAAVVCIGIVFLSWLAARKPVESVVEQSTPRVMVFTLAPGSLRSEGAATTRVPVPPKGFDLKLELELTNPNYDNYRSQLFRENEPLKTIDKLKMEAKGNQHIVPVTITGEILSPGDYQVKLSGVREAGENEFIDNYSFRVIE